jgi:DNA-binding PadR family transcriptional regulator
MENAELNGVELNDGVKELLDLTPAFASRKRVLLLLLLRLQPARYNVIIENFERFGVGIGSSEVYEHLKNLMEHQLVCRKKDVYAPTLRGVVAIKKLQEIVETPAETPSIVLKWDSVYTKEEIVKWIEFK